MPAKSPRPLSNVRERAHDAVDGDDDQPNHQDRDQEGDEHEDPGRHAAEDVALHSLQRRTLRR